MTTEPTISREGLRRIVKRAIPWWYGWALTRLLERSTDSAREIAVGRNVAGFGVVCPAGLIRDEFFREHPRRKRLYAQRFARRFDRLMRQALNLGPEPTVVKVVD